MTQRHEAMRKHGTRAKGSENNTGCGGDSLLNANGNPRRLATGAHVACGITVGLALFLITGCGLPSADVSPVKPLGADAAHVIPAATREYNAGLADVYEGLANRVENGELKTVREAATVAVSEDQRLRTEYKRALGDVMETRLGGEELPSDAPAFFRKMSAAFRRMSK